MEIHFGNGLLTVLAVIPALVLLSARRLGQREALQTDPWITKGGMLRDFENDGLGSQLVPNSAGDSCRSLLAAQIFVRELSHRGKYLPPLAQRPQFGTTTG